MSILFMATIKGKSAFLMSSKHSLVWAIMPSVAAITKTTKSVTWAPRALMLIKAA
ncbi:MAG: hypothetical protein UT14_C0059G0008 [Candidatus Shapirobacteria bacterium GW2011_GWE1_38_92]|uniref:Uncharacterized protein n=1 Tax=Candidatus Shapirobacteria bacterium GW2011_GWE1_38_92 TaxID=1618489 RepID=A0A0G0LBJ6_9BACT|nr:MAG: hypothetical protein UT14_C0059G0008 [Candidatus Shapirobacteria bacterium GW2011_GWE1_38_92]